MDLIKCPECGEYFSPSYRRCPFCEEEKNPRRLRYDTKNGRHKSEKKKTHSGRGALIVMLVLALGLLTWYQFGDRLAARFVPAEEPVSAEEPAQEPTEEPPQVPAEEFPALEEPVPTAVDASGAKLSNEDFTAGVGESVQLLVTGVIGDAEIVWSSENSAVASVSESGLVKCVSGGTTNITAAVGGRTLTCIARVNGAASGTPTGAGDVSGAKLSSEDFTAGVGESVQLRVTGTTASVSWSVENSAVASVSGSGLVKGVSAGQTKVYAKVGSRTLSCIVRIK